MNTVRLIDAARIVNYLPADGSSILETVWRKHARQSCRLPSYATRVCNWLLETGAVELRGDKSVARGRVFDVLTPRDGAHDGQADEPRRDRA